MNEPKRTDYSVADVAKAFNCSKNTVVSWIDSGKMKAYRLGGDGNYRVPWAEVDRCRSEWSFSPDTSDAL